MVTGGNSGLGFELVKILYCKGAKVYMASRTQSKAEGAIKAIQSTPTPTPGQVKFIRLVGNTGLLAGNNQTRLDGLD